MADENRDASTSRSSSSSGSLPQELLDLVEEAVALNQPLETYTAANGTKAYRVGHLNFVECLCSDCSFCKAKKQKKKDRHAKTLEASKPQTTASTSEEHVRDSASASTSSKASVDNNSPSMAPGTSCTQNDTAQKDQEAPKKKKRKKKHRHGEERSIEEERAARDERRKGRAERNQRRAERRKRLEVLRSQRFYASDLPINATFPKVDLMTPDMTTLSIVEEQASVAESDVVENKAAPDIAISRGIAAAETVSVPDDAFSRRIASIDVPALRDELARLEASGTSPHLFRRPIATGSSTKSSDSEIEAEAAGSGGCCTADATQNPLPSCNPV